MLFLWFHSCLRFHFLGSKQDSYYSTVTAGWGAHCTWGWTREKLCHVQEVDFQRGTLISLLLEVNFCIYRGWKHMELCLMILLSSARNYVIFDVLLFTQSLFLFSDFIMICFNQYCVLADTFCKFNNICVATCLLIFLKLWLMFLPFTLICGSCYVSTLTYPKLLHWDWKAILLLLFLPFNII
jgi:hypothetical protein